MKNNTLSIILDCFAIIISLITIGVVLFDKPISNELILLNALLLLLQAFRKEIKNVIQITLKSL